MTSPITGLNNTNFGCNTAKFGNAGTIAQQQMLIATQQKAQQVKEMRHALQAKRAGVDALYHALSIGALGYGLTFIGGVGKKVAGVLVEDPKNTKSLFELLTGGQGILDTLGMATNVLAPVSLLYGLYYFVNGKNKA